MQGAFPSVLYVPEVLEFKKSERVLSLLKGNEEFLMEYLEHVLSLSQFNSKRNKLHNKNKQIKQPNFKMGNRHAQIFHQKGHTDGK